MPLPGETFADYRSLPIPNNIPMLFGLQTQMRLGMLTYKDVSSPCAEMEVTSITIPLTLNFCHPYYEAVIEQGHYTENTEYLFSIVELAQGHQKLRNAFVGSSYSALCRTYFIETSAPDLDKRVEVTKHFQVFLLFT